VSFVFLIILSKYISTPSFVMLPKGKVLLIFSHYIISSFAVIKIFLEKVMHVQVGKNIPALVSLKKSKYVL